LGLGVGLIRLREELPGLWIERGLLGGELSGFREGIIRPGRELSGHGAGLIRFGGELPGLGAWLIWPKGELSELQTRFVLCRIEQVRI
jgi:hypothetical protein